MTNNQKIERLLLEYKLVFASMKIANCVKQYQGYAPAYGETAFLELIEKYDTLLREIK